MVSPGALDATPNAPKRRISKAGIGVSARLVVTAMATTRHASASEVGMEIDNTGLLFRNRTSCSAKNPLGYTEKLGETIQP